MSNFTESVFEDATLAWLESLGYAVLHGCVILHPAMANPTIVVLTDRNDLDDQLFGTFARCRDLLRQPPVEAADCAVLRGKLKVASGGVVFTTMRWREDGRARLLWDNQFEKSLDPSPQLLGVG